MNDRAMSKYRVSSSRTSSESRDSDSAVNPTRSAKSTETRRRSVARSVDAADGARPVVAERVPTWSAPIGAPHSSQNLACRRRALAQTGHVRTRRSPHPSQNFASDRLSVPQFAQSTFSPRRWTRIAAPKGTARLICMKRRPNEQQPPAVTDERHGLWGDNHEHPTPIPPASHRSDGPSHLGSL